MRILSVSMEGFGPFRDRQQIDLGDYDSDGLFLISGPTGAGKSTILDAICFALYGDTPRWHGQAAGQPQVRSDYCSPGDPTEVVLEFEVNGAEYRIRRSPQYERPKARGVGTTTQQATAVLEPRGGGAAIAVGPQEVAHHVQELVQLKADEFLQVILLAQGRFQEFLLARSDARLDLLTTLFDIGRFTDYGRLLDERRRDLGTRRSTARAAVDARITALAPGDAERPEPGGELAWLDALITGADADAGRHRAHRDEASDREDAARTRHETAQRQRDLASAEARLAELEARSGEIAAWKLRVEEAEHAARVRPLADAADDAAEALADARAAVARADADYPEGAPADPSADVDRLTGIIGELKPLVPIERRLADDDQALAAARAEAARITGALQRLADHRRDLEEQRRTAAEAAGGGEHARRLIDELTDRLAAARQAHAIAAQRVTAQEAELRASRASGQAAHSYADLLDRYLHGQAAVLAERLGDGEPCPVCGSLEHPSPARWSGEAVSDADLDRARAAQDDADAQARAARERVAALDTQFGELHGRTGGRTVGDLTADRQRAADQVTRFREAEGLVVRIDQEIAGDDTHPGLDARSADLATARDTAREREAMLAARIEQHREQVGTARDGFPTVAGRIADLTAWRTRATVLRDARRRAAESERQSVDAARRVADAAAREGFASLDAALAAGLAEGELAGLRTRLEAHADELSKVKGVLAQPQLQKLPTERIDPDAAFNELRSAHEAYEQAVSALAQAEARHTALVTDRSALAHEIAGLGDLDRRFEVLHRLTETVRGRTPNMRGIPLDSYVAAAELEAILDAANERLRSMSDGRYELLYSERGDRRQGASAGLEIEVFDEHTGRARSPRSLSGGETFLASLALALGLAEVVTARSGGIELSTLFIDEGFGSLDADTLEIAMFTLDTLRQGGRAIGLISHVDAMKEQIASQLQVIRTAHGWSEVRRSSGG